MKKLLLFATLFLATAFVKGEEIFFPTKVGTVLVYKIFDKNEKETNNVKYTIKNLNIKGNNMDITYLVESNNLKEKIAYKDEITIHKKGDILYYDMSNFINKSALQKNGEIPANIEITGNNMEVPTNPKPGDALPDANVMMAMNFGFINMRVSADVTNRKVETIEEISVKGGTFKCYKFTSDVTSSSMGIKMKSKNVEWYAKGIGLVRSETYDKNNKLLSHMELVEVHN